MFRTKQDDDFNINRKRNTRNTSKRLYNCAGYALGTFSWYCPHSTEDERNSFFGYDYGFRNEAEA